MIGFTAGIAIGAAVNNNYYYGPYGWHGGAYMYNDAWDDYYDHREDAREDWQDHREDLADERGDRAGTQQEQRTERQGTRQENRPESQAQRTGTERGADGVDRRRRLNRLYGARGSYESAQAQERSGDAGTKRYPLGRILRLFEREVGTRGQYARTEQPKQFALQKRRGGRRR